MPMKVEFRDTTEMEIVFVLFYRGTMSAIRREELEGIIDAWYRIGFYGGWVGAWFHELHNIHHKEDDKTGSVNWKVETSIRGIRPAVDVLVRCLERLMASEFGDQIPQPRFTRLTVG